MEEKSYGPHRAHLGERESSPMGHGAMRGPHPPWAAPFTPSLGISPTPEVEGGWHPSLAYMRRGRGALLIHNTN